MSFNKLFIICYDIITYLVHVNFVFANPVLIGLVQILIYKITR